MRFESWVSSTEVSLLLEGSSLVLYSLGTHRTLSATPTARIQPAMILKKRSNLNFRGPRGDRGPCCQPKKAAVRLRHQRNCIQSALEYRAAALPGGECSPPVCHGVPLNTFQSDFARHFAGTSGNRLSSSHFSFASGRVRASFPHPLRPPAPNVGDLLLLGRRLPSLLTLHGA